MYQQATLMKVAEYCGVAVRFLMGTNGRRDYLIPKADIDAALPPHGLDEIAASQLLERTPDGVREVQCATEFGPEPVTALSFSAASAYCFTREGIAAALKFVDWLHTRIALCDCVIAVEHYIQDKRPGERTQRELLDVVYSLLEEGRIIDGERYVTTFEAAEILGTSYVEINRLVKLAKLKGYTPNAWGIHLSRTYEGCYNSRPVWYFSPRGLKLLRTFREKRRALLDQYAGITNRRRKEAKRRRDNLIKENRAALYQRIKQREKE